jgi:hypothetical protein
MIKKKYMKPTMLVVKMKHHKHLLDISAVKTNSSSSGVDFEYLNEGGSPDDAG